MTVLLFSLAPPPRHLIRGLLGSELMKKVVYLNSHLEKFRKEPEIKIKLEDFESLSRYSNLFERDKKKTKIFVKCFKNKETYNKFLKKIPDNVDRLERFYLINYFLNIL